MLCAATYGKPHRLQPLACPEEKKERLLVSCLYRRRSKIDLLCAWAGSNARPFLRQREQGTPPLLGAFIDSHPKKACAHLPGQSNPADKWLFIMFVFARKRSALPRPLGAVLCFPPVPSVRSQSLPKLRLFYWDDSAAPPKGFFSYGKSEKVKASWYALLQNQTRICKVVRRFFDRMRQPMPAVLACGKDTLQIGTGRDFSKP